MPYFFLFLLNPFLHILLFDFFISSVILYNLNILLFIFYFFIDLVCFISRKIKNIKKLFFLFIKILDRKSSYFIVKKLDKLIMALFTTNFLLFWNKRDNSIARATLFTENLCAKLALNLFLEFLSALGTHFWRLFSPFSH